MESVPLETIYDALGGPFRRSATGLLRLERLDVRVPAYVLRLLE
jgi:hypothetical protein